MAERVSVGVLLIIFRVRAEGMGLVLPFSLRRVEKWVKPNVTRGEALTTWAGLNNVLLLIRCVRTGRVLLGIADELCVGADWDSDGVHG